MHKRWPLLAVLVATAAGFAFATVSTSDFAEHLDRQVHSIHCSVIPGLGTPDASGSSGCHATLMSPYSSVFRTALWGGIPISLPAMSVFAFLFFLAAHLLITRREADPKLTGFLTLGTALPFTMSILMGLVAATKVGAACTNCIGIYVSSTGALLFAFMQWREAKASAQLEAPATAGPGVGALFGAGVLFVALPIVLYLVARPNYAQALSDCGSLKHPEAGAEILVPIGPQTATTKGIEVLDPLCPACRAFEGRFTAAGFQDQLSRKALMFPLDNTCNWMVESAVHPGACAISEAVLCAGSNTDAVLAWAFENQDAIKAAAAHDPQAAARMAREKFPILSQCIGSPGVRARLNRSLRWAVSNGLSVLTPQLYVEGDKLCDEDTDLGLDYSLAHLIQRKQGGAQ